MCGFFFVSVLVGAIDEREKISEMERVFNS